MKNEPKKYKKVVHDKKISSFMYWNINDCDIVQIVPGRQFCFLEKNASNLKGNLISVIATEFIM